MISESASAGAVIAWGVIIGFFVGVFARSFLPLSYAEAGFAAVLALAALALSYADRAKRAALLCIAAALFSFGAGILRMDRAILVPDRALSQFIGKKVTIEGHVSDEPDVRENNTRVFIRAETVISNSGTAEISAGVLVIAPPHVGLAYGDPIRAEGLLHLPQSFETGAGREFDYPQFLAKDGIGYELAFAEVERLPGENDGNALKKSAIWIKQTFLSALSRSLPEPQAGLAGGITVGAKRGLGEELSNMFKTVSLIHVVVLSGYNITIVINAAMWMLSRAPRVFKFGGAAFIAVLFALMTGGAAASVRAAAMAIIASVGRLTGRVYLATRALELVAFGMVLWNPYVLAFDPGFQLSVLATLGLLYLTPAVIIRLPRITRTWGLREIAATTIATQIAVLPLLLYQNGQLPLFSLPANMLALVAMPPAMLFSAIAALGALVIPQLSAVIAFPAYALLSYIIGVAQFFASLPFSSLAIGAFGAWWLAVAYAILIIVFVFAKKKAEKHPGLL